MKRTIKLLMIFIGSLTAIIVGAISGYFIIAKNKTFYIYDVRLVEPVKGMTGYIYTDSEKEYNSLKNMTVYKNSEGNNLYPIAVYASSSTNDKDVKITSSDKSIAKIVYIGNNCYVQFLKEGLVTITSELYGVKDSFDIQIYDQLPSEFNVYDYEYYGDYAELFPNTILAYADDTEYRYKYFINNVAGTGDNTNVNGGLLRIDETNLKDDVFSKVYIDTNTDELVVKCKKPDEAKKDNIESTITLQSYYYTEDGTIAVENNYKVDVHIVLWIPEFLQIEVSSTQDFDEGIVFTNTHKIDISSLTEDKIINDPSLIDNYLSAEKAENYLSKNGEKATYNVFLTNQEQRGFYIRFRMVYTNGDIVYLKRGENAEFRFTNENYCKIGPTDDYYYLEVNDDYFNEVANGPFDIEVSLKDYNFSYSFRFELKNSTNANIDDFYDRDKTTGIYTFKYWDLRARFNNEVYDKFGNIIGFGA